MFPGFLFSKIQENSICCILVRTIIEDKVLQILEGDRKPISFHGFCEGRSYAFFGQNVVKLHKFRMVTVDRDGRRAKVLTL